MISPNSHLIWKFKLSVKMFVKRILKKLTHPFLSFQRSSKMWNSLKNRKGSIQEILSSQTWMQCDINNQMLNLKEHLLLDKENYEKRLQIVLYVSHTMKKEFPNCVTNLFGSSFNGLGFQGLFHLVAVQFSLPSTHTCWRLK